MRAAAASDEIIVSATGSGMKLSNVPDSAVELGSEDMAANPGLTLFFRLPLPKPNPSKISGRRFWRGRVFGSTGPRTATQGGRDGAIPDGRGQK